MRRHQLPIRRFFNPRCKQIRQPAMFADSRRQTFVAKVTNYHPQLERSKTTTELNAVIRSTAHLLLLRRA
jgi:hypothetical protein